MTEPQSVQRTTIVAVSLTVAMITVCAFAFSFGNIWHLARLWGVPDPIAPLVAPMLDISVVGLMVAVRHLTLHGIPARHLLGARLLLLVCAITTWALNIAHPALQHRWGAAVIDSVAPALLLGWSEVAPTLLRHAARLPPSETMTARISSSPTPAVRTAHPSVGPRTLAPPPGLPRLHPIPEQDSQGGAPDAA